MDSIETMIHGQRVMSRWTAETGTLDEPGAAVDQVLVHYDNWDRWELPDDLVEPTRENYDEIMVLNRSAGLRG